MKPYTAAYMVFQAQQSPPVTINFYDWVQSVSHSVVLELGQISLFLFGSSLTILHSKGRTEHMSVSDGNTST